MEGTGKGLIDQDKGGKMENIFTPFDPHGIHGGPLDDMYRVRLRLSSKDMAKIGRGGPWEATITDLATKRAFLVRDAACSLGSCRCAAEIVAEKQARAAITKATQD